MKFQQIIGRFFEQWIIFYFFQQFQLVIYENIHQNCLYYFFLCSISSCEKNPLGSSWKLLLSYNGPEYHENLHNEDQLKNPDALLALPFKSEWASKFEKSAVQKDLYLLFAPIHFSISLSSVMTLPGYDTIQHWNAMTLDTDTKLKFFFK